MLAEIKTYLMMLKASGNFAMLKKVETFTRTFPKTPSGYDFSTFDIDKYILRINDAVKKTEDEIIKDGYYSI